MTVFENPEDLGAVKSGEHRGVRPASMWQWEQFKQLLEFQQVSAVAFFQQDFGTQYLKPTRLTLFARVLRALMNKVFIRGRCNKGSQRYNWWGPQALPLPRLEQNNGLQGCAVGLQFSILQQFVRKHASDPVLAGEGGSTQQPSDKMGGSIQQPSDKMEYLILQPDGPKTAGGRGQPRQCQQPGKERQFRAVIYGQMGRGTKGLV